MNKPKNPIKKYALFLIILVAVSYFFIRNTVNWAQLFNIQFTAKIIYGILAAILMLVLRDLGYVLRMRLLTQNKISFWKTVKIIFLWEFGSAITPGMIGGKALAIFLLIQNKIKSAYASSIVLLAILLDEFVFILFFPILLFLFKKEMFHAHTDCPDWKALESKIGFLQNIDWLQSATLSTLFFITIFVLVVFVGVFLNPGWIAKGLENLSNRRFLNRWKEGILEFSKDILVTNKMFKNQSKTFWFKLVLFTLMSWVGRYMVAIALIWGFTHLDQIPLDLIYAKQYTLWFLFYIPTTPGSSGLAEAVFMAFYCPYFPEGASGNVAFVWRFISYYLYVIIGIIIILWNSNRKTRK